MSHAYRRFQHRHRVLFVLGANMAPCWPPKSRKILVWRVSGRLLGALGRLQEGLWRFQGGVERLQEVLAGEVLGGPGARPGGGAPSQINVNK